jgi:hypothetical protein
MQSVRLTMEGANILQGFRAAHAIAEAGFLLAVARDELERYELLNRYFQVPYVEDNSAPSVMVTVDVSLPSVSVGAIHRTLLYPHDVMNAFRACWTHDRPIHFGFCGHRSGPRRHALGSWILANAPRLPNAAPGVRHVCDVRFSEIGQKWPKKAWDPDYAATLGQTRFALCPNGFVVWTYRFFEAAAAGAIPVVQECSPHYEGFIYYTFADDPRTFEWTEAAATHNAVLVRDRMTASRADLSSAIQDELRRAN